MTDRPTCASISRVRQPILAGLLALAAVPAVSAQPHDALLTNALAAVSSERMVADIRALSDPAFRGRQAGTEADLRSAVWVTNRFTSLGIPLLATANGEQPSSPASGLMTSVISAPVIDPDPVLQTGPADALQDNRLSTDYLPVLDSPSADIQAPVVFVGYGTPADYADIDVAGSIVLFLRGKPEHAPTAMSHADKVRLARDKGAVAYLTVTGPLLNPYEVRRGITGVPGAFYAQMPPAEAIPGAWISTSLAEHLLDGLHDAHIGRLRDMQTQLNKDPTGRSVRTGHTAILRWKTTVQDGFLANAVAHIPGTGPDAIVIGAHRDHFGTTGGLLFPGADDNASGTAVILEVARVLAAGGWRPTRTLLFVSFSGEENNLLGSRWYIAHAPVPLASTRGMINVDHAGIGNGRLTVGITGLDKRLAQQAGERTGLGEKLDLFGFFPGGDHVPFKEVGIPTVTVVSGGSHPHFHQPTDTAETIKPEILQAVARYVLTLAWQLADVP